MYKEKLKDYESPTTDVLKVRFEVGVLTGSNLGGSGFDEKGNVKDNDTDGWGW